jgi:serine/threonine protein kinase
MSLPDGALRSAFTNARLANVRSLGRRPLTECFVGTHIDTGAELFIKALHADSPGMQRNFVREIDILQALRGRPGFPVVHAFSSAPGVMFHACERLYAPRFDQLARDASLEVDVILRLARALAGWLHRLHVLGYVHRDLSPDHVFASDQITVVDFGLAKRLDGLDAGARQRSIGYDVQAFGLVIWEMICGNEVFTYRSPGLALEIPPQLVLIQSVDLPPPLARTLTGCLAARSEISPHGGPHGGFVSAEEIVAALRWDAD